MLFTLVLLFCYSTKATYLLKLFFENFWLITGIYILFSIVQIAYTNPSFYFDEQSVAVKYPTLFRWKDFELNYDEIKLATFRHELFQRNALSQNIWFIFILLPVLQILIPSEYKWMKIETTKTKHLLFCFGLEFDYFSNHNDIRFETLKSAFTKRGVKTLWTATDDICFQND